MGGITGGGFAPLPRALDGRLWEGRQVKQVRRAKTRQRRSGSPRWSAPRFDCSPWGRQDAPGGPMGEHRRKADGRRVFSVEFKRSAVQRILSGEKTLAELSRDLDISPSVIRNWKRFAEGGATTAVQANEDVVPASQLREA